MSRQMNIITNNLKHFYQRPICWLCYLFLPMFAAVIFAGIMKLSFQGGVHFDYKPSDVFGPTLFMSSMINMSVAMFTVGLIGTVAARPFSVCLPGYKRVPVKIITGIGLLLNFTYVGAFVIAAGQFFNSFIFIFAFGMFIYANAATLGLRCINPVIFLASVVVTAVFGIVARHIGLNVLWQFLQVNALWISIIVLVACWLILAGIDAAQIAAKLSAAQTQAASDEMMKQGRRFELSISDVLQKLMNLSNSHSLKYGFGFAMAGLGSMTINLSFLLFISILVTVFCYSHDRWPLMAIIFFSSYFYSLETSIRMPLLLTCGRKERLKGIILGSLIYTVILTAVCFFGIFWAKILGTFMPPITLPLFGEAADFVTPQFRYLILIFFLTPMVMILFAIYGSYSLYFSMLMIPMTGIVMIINGFLSILPLIVIYAILYFVVRRRLLRFDLKFAR